MTPVPGRGWITPRPGTAPAGSCMLIGGAVCVAGAVVSQRLASETTGRTLTRTAGVDAAA
ncbi:hypothetical protein GCM10010472_36720 [Pseudonocardia halophobica]|uniref:Uncharacterized protein n=1 Tax=Pseudonocardia halophobica TaxID=29401 RepID=A0A9W6P162_9PSEU|nr:hypothetical protein GCM10017577_70510 [Pseudonocardia halophobica]